MKKTILSLGLFTILFNCSDRNDDHNKGIGGNNPSPTPPIDNTTPPPKSKYYLLKKITTTLSNGEIHTQNFSYNDDKLTEETYEENPNERKIIYYAGDDIIKISTSTESISFSYDNNGRLEKSTSVKDGVVTIETFTYVDIHTITSKKERDGILVENLTYRLIDGVNINSIKSSNPSNTIITTTYYSYDVFKNPYHNIKGYSKLNNPYYSERNIQDIVTDRKTVNSDGSTLNEKTSIIFTYVYNTALYPTEVYISRTGRNGVSKTIKHVYTYNQ